MKGKEILRKELLYLQTESECINPMEISQVEYFAD